MSIQEIIALFHQNEVFSYSLHSIRCSKEDNRWIVLIEDDESKFVIKIASNNLTAVERVIGWPDIISEYKKLGCYSPKMYKSIYGNYAETVLFQERFCVVWEEEYSQFRICTSFDKAAYVGEDGKYTYHDEVLAFIAKVGEKHFNHFQYPSGYVRLAPFGEGETEDEVIECVETFEKLVAKKAPAFFAKWKQIRALFEINMRKLSEIYDKLPTSVFQADASQNNLLLDEDGHFVGLIDYNLAGKDVVLNQFLSVILFGYSYHSKRLKKLHPLAELNRYTQDSLIQILLHTLKQLRRYYTFNELEAKAAPFLFKYIFCVGYKQIQALQKCSDDPEKLTQLFDFMENELLREDIDFHSVMLG